MSRCAFAAILLVLTGCTGTTSVDVDQCLDGSPCPVGAFTVCAVGDDTVECCQNSTMIHACARTFGTLTHACPMYGLTCDSGECAVDLVHGAIACCQSHDPLDPCSQ